MFLHSIQLFSANFVLCFWAVLSCAVFLFLLDTLSYIEHVLYETSEVKMNNIEQMFNMLSHIESSFPFFFTTLGNLSALLGQSTCHDARHVGPRARMSTDLVPTCLASWLAPGQAKGKEHWQHNDHF